MSKQTTTKNEEATKQAEQAWHDSYFRAHGREDFPGTTLEFVEWFKRVDLTPFCDGGWSYWADPRVEALSNLKITPGMRVLDYGCGSGKLGVYFALQGASVWGFDLSAEGIEVAKEAAARYGTDARFEQMDAEHLRYEDEFFDLVVGFGVVHHVIKYPAAAQHLHRILRPQGKAIFVETLWDNPLINAARRFTTADDDAGDAHLTERGIYEFCRGFSEIRLEKRNLLYMLKRCAKLPERNLSAPLSRRPVWRLVKAIDKSLLQFRPLRKHCGEVIIYLGK
jgi:2-polyprenyl-3-methyl-5-hydroxy-6-metoxy-1,4-benzoquinol methylase